MGGQFLGVSQLVYDKFPSPDNIDVDGASRLQRDRSA